jgi:predicted nicotinamide N-methyase
MAVLSSYVAAYSALNLGAKVGIINFSDKTYVQDFTNDPMKVEKALVKYQGGGTTMPTTEIGTLVKKNPNPVQMLLISDAEIYNYEEGFKNFIEATKYNPANRGAAFLIQDQGRPKQEKVNMLESAGIELFPVEKEEDLFNLVVGKTNSVYGGDSTG